MTRPPPASLLAWMEVDEEDDDRFNSWYSFEHVPERLAIDGFQRCCRYRSVGTRGETIYFTMYDVADLDVLASPQYLDRLNHPTLLTRATAPLSRLLGRGALAQLHRWGPEGVAGVARVIPLAAKPEEIMDSVLHEDLSASVVGALGPSRALFSARLLTNAPATARARDATDEGTLSTAEGEVSDDLLVLEADGVGPLKIWADQLADAQLSRTPLDTPWSAYDYQLMFVRAATP